jgi:hypothetical protein
MVITWTNLIKKASSPNLVFSVLQKTSTMTNDNIPLTTRSSPTPTLLLLKIKMPYKPATLKLLSDDGNPNPESTTGIQLLGMKQGRKGKSWC